MTVAPSVVEVHLLCSKPIARSHKFCDILHHVDNFLMWLIFLICWIVFIHFKCLCEYQVWNFFFYFSKNCDFLVWRCSSKFVENWSYVKPHRSVVCDTVFYFLAECNIVVTGLNVNWTVNSKNISLYIFRSLLLCKQLCTKHVPIFVTWNKQEWPPCAALFTVYMAYLLTASACIPSIFTVYSWGPKSL